MGKMRKFMYVYTRMYVKIQINLNLRKCIQSSYLEQTLFLFQLPEFKAKAK